VSKANKREREPVLVPLTNTDKQEINIKRDRVSSERERHTGLDKGAEKKQRARVYLERAGQPRERERERESPMEIGKLTVRWKEYSATNFRRSHHDIAFE
jgi:hypothetical protein